MRSDTDMKQPYGPGWEDPDWTPPRLVPSEPPRLPLKASPGSLTQFMEMVRRVARPLRAANAKHLGAKEDRRARERVDAGQTRRWVVASGASLLAIGSFALPREPKKSRNDRA
ncbi:MAG TPA: hypothetical protein VH328_17025 [Burkholderiaceae bacterium]|nr:hypothetical protein [Burkholderiaceae bacterium]